MGVRVLIVDDQASFRTAARPSMLREARRRRRTPGRRPSRVLRRRRPGPRPGAPPVRPRTAGAHAGRRPGPPRADRRILAVEEPRAHGSGSYLQGPRGTRASSYEAFAPLCKEPAPRRGRAPSPSPRPGPPPL